MVRRFRYYLVTENGDVQATDDHNIASAAASDGSTTVVDTHSGQHTFDGMINSIEQANEADWIESGGDEEGNDEGEEDLGGEEGVIL